MQVIQVKSADGTVRKLAMVHDQGASVLACSLARYEKTPQDELDQYLVGFPKSDIVSSDASIGTPDGKVMGQ